LLVDSILIIIDQLKKHFKFLVNNLVIIDNNNLNELFLMMVEAKMLIFPTVLQKKAICTFLSFMR
jgi:hypothetical protein